MTTETVVSELVLAKLAAHTALHTAGVARLEPGVAGMVSQFGRWGREHATGHPELPHEGAHARTDDDGAHLHLDIVTTGTHRAADVAHHLRVAVAEDLTAAAGVTVAAVTVTVLDIDTTDGLLTDPGPTPGPALRTRSATAPVVGHSRGRPMNTPLDPAQIEDVLAAALGTIDGLRLAPPARSAAHAFSGTYAEHLWDTLAITATGDRIDIHLVASTLPLRRLLDEVAARAATAAVHGTPWAGVPIRLIVDDLDPAALL